MPRCPRMFGHLLPLLRRWLCSTRRQRPEHLFGTPCRIGHRNESWALPSLCRATPSATSEHLLGLLDSSPIPPSSSLLRASPSPHTARPDSREVPVDRRLHDHRWGFPCCFRSLLLACRRQYPGRSDGTCSLVLFHQRRPSLDSRRVGSCVTRFGACSAFTQVTAYMLAKSPMRPSTPEASAALLSPPPLRLLPGGANQFPGGTFTRSGPALFTAHAKVGLGLNSHVADAPYQVVVDSLARLHRHHFDRVGGVRGTQNQIIACHFHVQVPPLATAYMLD